MTPHRRTSPVAWAALVVAVLAVVLSASGIAPAAIQHAKTAAKGKAKKKAKSVVLDKNGRIPARYLPKKVTAAKDADTVGGQSPDDLTASCAPTTVDLGTYCMMASPYPLTNDQLGKNNYFFASQACTDMGGYLPTAAQLIGAAAKVKLSSTIDDSALAASIDQDASDGLKDRREMTSTLITTAAGSSAAGSEGVTDGSKGDPKQGEPDPTPLPANPQPETLQYVTVYDNHDKGGFAGAQPVAKPESFRCAFNKVEGASSQENG
jgi:hypothetical protein